MRHARVLLTGLILMGIITAGLSAQVVGALKGVIKDAKTGAVIAEVKITITSAQSQSVKYQVSTDKDGYFYQSGLYPGNYTLMVEKKGYVPVSTSLRVSAGATRDSSLEIEPAVAAPATGFARGLELVNAGNFAEAIPLFDQAIAEDAKNPMAHFYRGYSLEKSGQAEPALASYLTAVEHKPDFVLGLASIAKLYAKKSEFQKAADWYKKAFDLGLTDGVSIYNYGVCVLNLGQSDAAKAVFEKLVALDPENADGLYQLGILCIEREPARAKELLQKFLQIDPQNANAAVAQEILKSLK